MLTPKLVKNLPLRAPDLTDVIPAQRGSEDDASGINPPLLFGLQVTGHATNAPSVNDDETNGHVAPMFWVRASPFSIYLCTDATDGAAVWTNITAAASITGLTNPLAESLNAASNLLYDAAFAGFRDRYYNLATDPSSLVAGGVASLNQAYNAWHYDALSSALAIKLPDPASVGSLDALFGVVSVSLADGGSVTIDDTYPWAWEKANSSDPDPALESAEHTHLRLRYQYDPVAERYAVHVGYMTYAPPSVPQVLLVASSATHTNLSANNRSTHEHTHQFTSTEQDGTVLLLVALFSDGDGSVTAYPSGFTPINDPAAEPYMHAHGNWYWYHPTQGELDAVNFPMAFTKNNEIAQIAAFEVTGAHPSSPIAATGNDRSTSTSRASAGPVSLAANAGDFMVASLGSDVTSTSNPTAWGVSNANGFTTIAQRDSVDNGSPSFIVTVREIDAAGTIDSPTFGRLDTRNGAAQVEAFVVVPAP